MENKRIKYKHYSQGEEDGIVELLRLVFPKWKAHTDPLTVWRWKYLQGNNPPDIVLAKDGELVVGVAHRLVLDLKIGGSIVKAQYGDDLAIHPEYREFGIWKTIKQITDEAMEKNNIKFHYIATENPIVKEKIPHMGLTPTKHTLTHLVKIRDKDAFLKKRDKDNLVTRVGISALTRLGEAKSLFNSDTNNPEDVSITDAQYFDEKINIFWDIVKNDFDYCIVKKANYLNWKFSRPGVSEQRIRQAIKDGKVLGYSVISLRESEDYREGAISDLSTLPGRLNVADALIKDACEHTNQWEAAATIFQATKGHPYEELAIRNGFIDASSQNSTNFYYRILDKELPPDYLDRIPPERIQLNYF